MSSSKAHRVPLSVPELSGGNAEKYLKECLDSGWVSSVGPFVDRFEREIAAAVKVPHAVATTSGTAALHTALMVVGVREDEEVIVSDLTFIAPVNAIRYCGAHPVFMDADPETWQMDTGKLERFLENECVVRGGRCMNRRSGRRVRAVLPVHILGLACDMERVLELAGRYGLRVVEDAAEAMGVRVRGQHAGTFADAGVFSFNGNKIITSGGGGMLVTRDSGLAQKARYLTTQAKDDGDEDIHNEVGYNYRLTNIQSALGLAQLERLAEFIERKTRIRERYVSAFREASGLTTMPVPANVNPTFWLYTVLLPPGTPAAARCSVIGELKDQGFEARALWTPAHRQPPYRSSAAYDIRVAEDLHSRGISLPSSVGTDLADISRCAEALIGILERQFSPSRL